jgi:hypothetical protein
MNNAPDTTTCAVDSFRPILKKSIVCEGVLCVSLDCTFQSTVRLQLIQKRRSKVF